MNKFYHNISHILFLGFILSLLVSCQNETVDSGPNLFPNPTRRNETLLQVELLPLGEVSSRAIISQEGDLWSYTNFSQNGGLNPDRIGFYSLYGNREGEDGNGSFINEPMTYQGAASTTMSSFTSSNMDCDISSVVWNKTCAYFPYTEQMVSLGLELRKLDEASNIKKCEDMLFMSNLNQGGSSGVAGMSARFSHAFSEIIFLRGEGFDDPTNPDITVVLDKGYSHAKIVVNTHLDVNNLKDSWKMIKLEYNQGYGLSEEECREWGAWKGADYNGQEAYYVILPTMSYTDRCKVSYIKIWDNYGVEHNISSIPLYNNSTGLYNGHRYPVEIKMEELVPVVNPYEVVDWDEDQNVTETHALGINSTTDFVNWIKAYNGFISNGDNESTLLKFGDKIERDGETHWHFYISENINFSNGSEFNSLKILQLKDILDGRHHTLSNLFLNNSGLIESIEEGGEVIDLNFEAFSVTTNLTTPVGTLATTINGGTVSGCTIDSSVVSDGRVGALAGTINGGVITKNSFTSLLIGTQTSQDPKGIAGIINSGTFNNNNLSGILFTAKSN